jgi:hypothetical protein
MDDASHASFLPPILTFCAGAAVGQTEPQSAGAAS